MWLHSNINFIQTSSYIDVFWLGRKKRNNLSLHEIDEQFLLAIKLLYIWKVSLFLK
jgi:hypothetical protein